eukprot:7100765-Alexandrium_andersonii.AAC.1
MGSRERPGKGHPCGKRPARRPLELPWHASGRHPARAAAKARLVPGRGCSCSATASCVGHRRALR